MYGGEITDIIYTASEGTYKLKRPTMYSALKRLQDKKLVSVRREDSPIGGTRNYYALTKQGHEYLSGGKFDWVYSKLLIDNLILNKRSKSSGLGEDEEETTVTTTTTTITTTEEETPLIVPAPDQVYIEPLAPIEPPIINEPQLLPIAEVEADKVEEFTSVLAGHVEELQGGLEPVTLDLDRDGNVQVTSQLGVDLDKLDPLYVHDGSLLLKPFVKHAANERTGKFVLYHRLKFVCAILVSIFLVTATALFWALFKDEYTTAEINILVIGLVCVGVYLAVNVLFFVLYPRYKTIITNKLQGIIRRAVLSACVAVSAISINVILGLSTINAEDFVVFCIVPAIIGSMFLLEGLAIFALKKRAIFLT